MNSMTGYGRVLKQQDGYDLALEIRAVNHRYLECTVKLPRSYGYLEDKIKEMVQKRIARGKVEVALTLHRQETETPAVQVNHAAVCRSHYGSIQRIPERRPPEPAVQTALW